MARREMREAAAKLLLDRLFAKIDVDDPLGLHDEIPVPAVEDEDWSLFEVLSLDEAETITSKSAGVGPSTEPVSGRKPVTIRVPNRVLRAFRQRADKTGTAYQTLMNRALESAAEEFA